MTFPSSPDTGLSHGLVAELTVYEESQSALSEIAFDWLTEGVKSASVRGEIGHLPAESPMSTKGFGDVHGAVSHAVKTGWWGYLAISPRDTFDVLYNPYGEIAFPWLRDHIEDRPESAAAKIGRFHESGEVGNSIIRLSVSFDEELPDYVKLSYRVDEAVLVNPASTDTEHARMLATVNRAARLHNVVFGHFSYAHAGEATELERYTRGPSRVPNRNTPLWRSRARGYSWLTVVSGDIARQLGGVDRLRESGAFYRVEKLPCGSVLLQATESFQEYRGERVKAVYRVLKSVLISGELRYPPPVPDQPSTHMILFDVAD